MRENSFGDSITMVQGHPFISEHFNEEGRGMPLVRIRDVKRGRSETYTTENCPSAQVVEDGALLIGMDGDFNMGRWLGGRAALNQRVMMLGPSRDGTSVEFAALWLEPQLKRIHATTTSTTVKHLSSRAVASLPFAPPPHDEQRRIVDLIAAVDDAVDAADMEAEASRSLYVAQLTSLFAGAPSRLPLGTALQRSAEVVKVDATTSYRLVGVLRSGEGLIDRGSVIGADISYATLTRLRADQLVYRKLTAWEGPISVATAELADTFASSEFPVFSVDTSLLLPGLLRHYCRWPGLWDMMRQRIQGSVLRRMRLSPDQLESIEVPMPPVAVQEAQLLTLDSSFDAADAARATADALRVLRGNLLTVLLAGEHEIPSSYDALLGEIA